MKRRTCTPFVMMFCALLVMGLGLAFPTAVRAGQEFTSDGYLRWDGDCLVVREHEGKSRVLTGAIEGLDEEDHVLLLGHTVTDGDECNDYDSPAYYVTEVWALWASDNHKRTYYDHETDGSFRAWVRRNRSE